MFIYACVVLCKHIEDDGYNGGNDDNDDDNGGGINERMIHITLRSLEHDVYFATGE